MQLARFVGLGFANGYFVLHPAAMILFGVLHDAPAHAAGSHSGSSVLTLLADSFGLHMLPMAMAFGLLGSLVGAVYGLQSAKIRAQRDSLETELRRVDALSRELEHRSARLSEQNERLAALQQMKQQMTRYLVHDLKNHLTCIDGFGTLMLEMPQVKRDIELQSRVLRIHRRAVEMGTELKNLLDIGRLEDEPALRLQPTRPLDLLERALEDMEFTGRKASVVVEPLSAACPAVMVEPDLIRRVLLNLAINALKHNRRGVAIVLSARPREEAHEVVFSCQDDGIGVTRDDMAMLFVPFWSGGAGAAGSTGLGLAFVRSTIRAHGGDIWCESVPGRGATFSFTVPAVPGAAEREPATPAKPGAEDRMCAAG